MDDLLRDFQKKKKNFLKPSTRTPSQHTKTHFQHVHFLHTGPEVRQIRSRVALQNSHDGTENIRRRDLFKTRWQKQGGSRVLCFRPVHVPQGMVWNSFTTTRPIVLLTIWPFFLFIPFFCRRYNWRWYSSRIPADEQEQTVSNNHLWNYNNTRWSLLFFTYQIKLGNLESNKTWISLQVILSKCHFSIQDTLPRVKQVAHCFLARNADSFTSF